MTITAGEWRRVPGADLTAQAIRIAGALAEMGVPTCVLMVDNHPPVIFNARSTDLPLVLRDLATVGRLTVDSAGIEVRCILGELVWHPQPGNPHAGDDFAARLVERA